MTELRRCTASDPEFLALVRELDRLLKVLDGDDHEFFNAQNHPETISHAIVASIDGRPVGCGGFRRLDDDTAEIKRMYVDPKVRGRGIGKEVLHALEIWAFEEGFTHTRLETSKRLEPAVRLYTSSGYAVIPNFGVYAEVEDSVCMERALMGRRR